MSGLCGCCQPPVPLTPVSIANRPGLSAIAYRIGVYTSFRETMTEAIARTPELTGLGTRHDDDYVITVMDLWAAVSDVLTFYQERYANEVFLRTAKQTVSLKRLAGLLGYDPAPGVAALAELAFTVDSGKVVQVPVGLRVQSVPGQNQQPQTFETIEAASVDWRFNSLRIFPPPFTQNPLQKGNSQAVLDRRNGPQIAAKLSPNDHVVIYNNGGFNPVEEKKIDHLQVQDDREIVAWTQPVQSASWTKFSGADKFRRKMQLFGFNVQTRWFHPVVPVPAVPGGIGWVFDPLDFTLPARTDYYLDSRYSDLSTGTRLLFVVPLSVGGIQTIARTVIQVDQSQQSFGPLTDTVSHVILDGALPFCNDLRSAVIYELIGDHLSFWDGAYNSTINSATLYLPGIVVEDQIGIGVEVGRTISQNGFVPGVVIHSQDLEAGRKLLLTDATNQPIEASLHAPPEIVPPSPIGSFVHLALTVDAKSISLETDSALLLGNIVLASHGETFNNEVVGSGDASQKFQSFELMRQPLTYVPGSGPNGVVSSLNVRVNGLSWQEVPGLYQQAATAQVFSTSTAEDGGRLLQFGDAYLGGTVLPTRQGNITATYRVGAGLAGRVGANALTTLLDRLQGLTSVSNPLNTEGGADAESLANVRGNAPRTVRTFGRAVSLQDFADLITASGEVAKAQAMWIWDGLAPAVHLTVAGQAGGVFANPASLAANLNTERDPNRRLLVGNFVNVPIVLSARILVLPQYVSDSVLSAVRAALLDALSFDSLSLGQSIHLSFVYSVMQAVAGVAALDITLLGFRQPDGMSNADFKVYLDRRAVERLADGSVAPVQSFLRIFPARPDPANAGVVLPAELASVQTPGQDISITAQGS